MAIELKYLDSSFVSGSYDGVWGDGTYIYVARDSAGLSSYSVDAGGNITLVDTNSDGIGEYNSVWGDGSFLYVAQKGAGMCSYSVDGSGVLTYIDDDDQGSTYYHVWGDGTFVYVAGGSNGLHSYSVDGSGNLTHIDTDDQSGIYYGVWGDGTYLYAACGTSGIRSYSVDGAGALTYIDTDDQGDDYTGVWGDGTYIYAARGTGGLSTYTVDGGGNFTHVDADDQGGVYNSVWGANSRIFVATDTLGVLMYTQTAGVLSLLDSDNTGTDAIGVWADSSFVYATSDTVGLHTYMVPVNPADKRYTRNIVSFCNDKVYYGPDPDNLVELSDASGDIDCSKPLVATEAYGQVFVANHDKHRVADFVNVKTTTANIGANIPYKGDIVTGGTSSAQMVVDFITAASGAATLYGNRITDETFVDTETVTGTNKNGDAISFVLNADEASGPFWYTWTPYANDTTNFGTMPTYSDIIELHIGRVWLGGDKRYPHQWVGTRQNNPWDFLYAQNDAGSAVAGNNTDAGEVGDIVIDMISYSDDYMVFGCAGELHVMLGNPCAGGRINKMRETGLLATRAWCWDADSNLYLLTTEGLLKVPKGFGQADNITSDNYPDFVDDLAYNADNDRITMAYDPDYKGVLISKITISTGASTSWFIDLRSGGFFPEAYPVECGQFSAWNLVADDPDDTSLVMGCTDGYLRHWDSSQKSDDAGASGETAIEAYVGFGPFPTSEKVRKSRRISGIDIVLGGDGAGSADDSDDVYCKVFAAMRAEAITGDMESGTSPRYTKTHKQTTHGKGQTDRRKVFGKWVGLVVGNDALAQSFAFEHLDVNGI